MLFWTTVFGQQTEKMVCFSSHLQAAKFIGIATLILHSILLAVFSAELKGEFRKPTNQGATGTSGVIGTLGVLVFVDVGLVYGSFKKIGSLMTTWSVVVAIFTVLNAIGTIIWVIFTTFRLEIFLLGVAITLGNIRAIVTVSMAVTEIDQEKCNAVISIAVKEVASNSQIKYIA